MDPDLWIQGLRGDVLERDMAAQRLHALLVRVARGELHRRSGQLAVTGPERDDLAHQCAADAMVALLGKLEQFRGECRFTTWAYKFVIFEVSSKVARHFWQTRHLYVPNEDWEQLPDRLGVSPEQKAEHRELVEALHDAVRQELTPRRREIFAALVIDEVPLDALALRLGINRNAVYQTMFKVRRKLRAALVARGFLHHESEWA